MAKYWIVNDSSLFGPFSDEKIAKELCGTKQVLAIDNEQDDVSEVKLTTATAKVRKSS